MKRWLIFLFLVCMLGGFVSSSVVVHNASVEDVFLSTDIINGTINLTIVEEDYDAKITSNNHDEIGLGEFLVLNSVTPDCSTSGCVKGYAPSGDITGLGFSIPASGKKTIGFVLYGDDVVLDGLSFSIASDFGESYRVPLKIEFFENADWEFGSFSNTFLPKDWGCYDITSGEIDSRIGSGLYCEEISIPETGKLRVGADVSIPEGETGDLTMSVYEESGVGVPETCNFDPNSEEFCLIEEYFPVGSYHVCINAEDDTNYKIYEEAVDENCGFVYSSQGESTTDYAIFVQSVRYANSDLLIATEFNSGDFNEDLVDAANYIIGEGYKGDCSGGCILPMSFSGVFQNVTISNVKLEYKDGEELVDDDEYVYDLNISTVRLNFSGILDIGKLGFSVSKSMDYIVSLGSQKLFNITTEILLVPEISSVLPLNPPAGVPIQFYAKVNFSNNSLLNYKWDFGDGEVTTTSEPSVIHNYVELGNYTLTLEVGVGSDLTASRSFEVDAINPRTAVNVNLVSKRATLDGIISSLSNFTFWYKDALSDIANATFFSGELDKLDVLRDDATVDQDFVNIAGHLYTLNIPAMINIKNTYSPHLITKIKDVDSEAVAIAGHDDGEGSSTDYAQSILAWQNKNIDASFSREEFLISLWNGDSDGVLSAYSFNISSDSDERSYFIINMPLSELTFRENVGAEEAGGSTAIALDANEDVSFEFYYEDDEAILFFVSPKLGSIALEGAIDTSCNYNFVCEDGENAFNCRSDCKPVTGAIIYVIIAIAVMIFIYTILQVWYKHKYERYLFKDDRQMYNLLMYVTNARAQGMKDSRIAAVLRGRGWASERVSYIIKKSRGKRTGLVEIIPIEKVAAFLRNRKARNVQAAKVVAKGPLPVGAHDSSNIATGNRRQMERNINKSKSQRKI